MTIFRLLVDLLSPLIHAFNRWWKINKIVEKFWNGIFECIIFDRIIDNSRWIYVRFRYQFWYFWWRQLTQLIDQPFFNITAAIEYIGVDIIKLMSSFKLIPNRWLSWARWRSRSTSFWKPASLKINKIFPENSILLPIVGLLSVIKSGKSAGDWKINALLGTDRSKSITSVGSLLFYLRKNSPTIGY